MPMPRCVANLTLFKRITIAILFVLAIPAVSLGCSYFSYPDPPSEYIVSRTKTIFLGTLLEKRTRVRKEEGDKYKIYSLIFRVEQKLKDDPGDTYVIEYWDRLTRRDSCYVERPNLKVGEKWVIYHGYDEGDDTLLNVRDPDYLSWRFSRNDSRSKEKLKTIKHIIANPRSTFFGEVEMAMFDTPADDSSLIAELLDSSRTTTIRTAVVERGSFSFPDLGAGKYVVRLRSAKKYRIFQPAEVVVEEDSQEASYFADFKIEMRSAVPAFLTFALGSP